MSEILRTRRISPDTRLASSVSYKVNTEAVGAKDTLRVEITHANKPGRWIYNFDGHSLVNRKSISFTAKEINGGVIISWSAVDPLTNGAADSKTKKKYLEPKLSEKTTLSARTTITKHSFNLVADTDTKVLILGSLPGEKSLQLQQYYANPTNQFWKILTAIVDKPVPNEYSAKLEWLKKNGIGIWDVCHSASRDGSLDSNIKNEIPNDITGLLKRFPNIKLLLFNGLKAYKTFCKYFVFQSEIKYGTLISSSSAATTSLEMKIRRWKQSMRDIEFN